MHVLAVYLLPLLVVLVMRLVGRVKKSRDVDRNLDEWGRELGLVRVGNELVGRIGEVPVGARLAFDRPGLFDATWTLYARLQPPLDLGILVHNHTMHVELPSAGHHPANASYGAFDTNYSLRGDEPARLRQLMSPPVTRTILQSIHPSAPLLINDDGIAVQGARSRGTTEWLRQGLHAVATTAEAINQARDGVASAARFATLEHGWTRFARDNGLHLLRAPLCIWGTIDGASIYAYANRLDPDEFCLEVFSRFEKPLGLGLLVQPKRTIDRVKNMFGAMDHKLGDEVFDQTFLVVVSDAAGVEDLLDDELRGHILELHGSVGPFTMTDDGASFRLPSVPADPTMVPGLVRHLIAIADHVAARRFGTGRGPYR
jgi:hypothetical protein